MFAVTIRGRQLPSAHNYGLSAEKFTDPCVHPMGSMPT
jgi:hypothetical protein